MILRILTLILGILIFTIGSGYFFLASRLVNSESPYATKAYGEAHYQFQNFIWNSEAVDGTILSSSLMLIGTFFVILSLSKWYAIPFVLLMWIDDNLREKKQNKHSNERLFFYIFLLILTLFVVFGYLLTH